MARRQFSKKVTMSSLWIRSRIVCRSCRFWSILHVTGTGTHPETLEKAGVGSVDLLIVVMTRDEANMVACQMACFDVVLPVFES